MNKTTVANIYEDYTILEGYAWLQQQANSIHGALNAVPELGDWPYVCYVAGQREDVYVVKEFCEHDVKTWVFPNKQDYSDLLKSLKESA